MSASETPAPDQERLRVQHAPQYDFMQVVRYLSAAQKEGPKPGDRGSFARERVVFRHNPSLSSRSSDIQSIREQDGRVEIESNFLGLCGSVSPMAHYMIEGLATPGPESELSRHYLDIFHHRLYGLLFRGLQERDLPIQASQAGASLWQERLVCLLGIDSPNRPQLRHLDRQALLRLAPLLSTHAKPRARIEAGINMLLKPFLTAPDGTVAKAQVHPLEGEWNPIEPDTLLRVGRANHALGTSAILGRRVEHRACRARIEVTPLHSAQQKYFAAGSAAYNQLSELLSLCTQDPIDFELDLHIYYRSQDHCTLGRSRLSVDAVLPGPNRDSFRRIRSRLEIPPIGR